MISQEVRILSAAQMNTVDRETQSRYGIEAAILMENAGRGVYELVRTTKRDGRIVCIAGSGHNGGDALVTARLLHCSDRYEVAVVTIRDSLKDLSATQLARLDALKLSRIIWESDPETVRRVLATADLIVEGISGTGLTGALRGLAASLVYEINATGAPVVAIDVPSGARLGMASEDPIVRAATTVVTGNLKDLLYCARVRPVAGEIVTVDPGFPGELIEEIASGGDRRIRLAGDARIRRIAPEEHKNRRGRLLVIGGSTGSSGAAILAGEAALHSGAGMVRILSEPATVAAALVREPAILGEAIPAVDDDSRWDDLLDWADALVIGPGWTSAAVEDLVALLRRATERSLPAVVDATALRVASVVFESLDEHWVREKLVLTPHPGEMAALLGSDGSVDRVASDPFGALEEFRARCPATIVLKDAVTIIASSDFVVVDGREPALGTAGSGDVLAGVTGAYLAQGNTTAAAAEGAVIDHLATGRELVRRSGWFSASELARSLVSSNTVVDTR